MAARDRYTWGINCSDCGKEGTAKISEADHPWIRRLDREIDGITEGFTVVQVSDHDGKTLIDCECGKRINM